MLRSNFLFALYMIWSSIDTNRSTVQTSRNLISNFFNYVVIYYSIKCHAFYTLRHSHILFSVTFFRRDEYFLRKLLSDRSEINLTRYRGEGGGLLFNFTTAVRAVSATTASGVPPKKRHRSQSLKSVNAHGSIEQPCSKKTIN